MEFSTHYLLMADHAMLQKLVMSRIKPLGLTTGQPKVLDFLQDHDGAMQKDIAQGCHIEPSSLSTILGGMERAGLLERSTRDENRRTVDVRLPGLGREPCRRVHAIVAAAGDAAGTDPARAYLSQSKQLKGDKIGMKGSKLGIRLLYYFGGFFVMTIGIALSVKSNLGVSPVSSIPYTMTCVWGIEMGVATVIFHVILVILQMLLMRRRFECKNLLQIPVGMVFGAFTTTCNTLAAIFPSTDNLIIRLLMCWIATVFVAIGIFFYVPADIMPLAGEGAMLAISTLTGKPFPTVKIAFDVSMVIISLITCLIFLHGLGSVGIGTVIAALLVGIELRMITHRFGRWRDKLLGKQSEI